MKRTIFSFLILIAVTISCTKEIELDLSFFEPEPVVNCLFNENSFFDVTVTETQKQTDTVSFKPIKDAIVTIHALKANFSKTLRHQGNGHYYDTLFYPKQNESYRLEVKVEGHDILTATDSIPPSPEVRDVWLERTGRVDQEFNNIELHDIHLTLNDSLAYPNYYELKAFEQGVYRDTIFYHAAVGITSDEPFIINEGDQELMDNRLLFSDELIDGQTIQFITNPKCQKSRYLQNDSIWNIDFYVISISKDFYDYRKRLIRHWAGASQQDILESIEPVPMYTNIKNGYGVFAGYTFQKFRLFPVN